MKLEHIAFDVSEPEALITWWCKNLGFRRSSPGSAFIFDCSGVSGIEVYRTDKTASAPNYAAQNAMTMHIAFAVEDVAAEAQRLVAAGGTLESLSVDKPDFHMAIVRDPWGIPIQLCWRAKSVFLAPCPLN